MKRIFQFGALVLLSCLMSRAESQGNPVQVSLCDLVHNPAKYTGKLVSVRGQFLLGNLTGIPPDLQVLQVRCGPVPVSFSYLTSLIGRRAFVTLIGRIKLEPAGYGGAIHGTYHPAIRLYAEQEIDIQNAEDLNGPVVMSRW